jgi:L-threonylcarbamoyladenylate synthase
MHPSPTTAQHVLDDLIGRVDIILDGGPCPIGLESTVIDLIHSDPVLLRPGGAPLELIQEVIPNISVKPEYLQVDENFTPAASPGMLSRHYSPKAKLYLVAGAGREVVTRMRKLAGDFTDAGLKVGIMAADEDAPAFEGLRVKIMRLGSRENLSQVGQNLFAGMRALDKEGVDVILAGEFSREGIGLAIWDRLVRASEGQVI